MMPTSFARKAIKFAVLPVGALRPRRRGDHVILLYHRVGSGGREVDLPTSDFERQLSWLAERDTVVSLDRMLSEGSPGGVVLTFDDGFGDFHRAVLPLLLDYRIPAVLYVATSFVANGRRGSADALTWSQIQEAVATGLVTVGSHTHGHIDLSRADERTAEDEMHRSKELIEERLGVPCRHFAYPWAVGSAVADQVARRLFDSAALDAWRTNRVGRVDPHRLGRIPILRSDGRWFFRAKVRGVLDGEAWAYRLLGRGPWGRP